MTQHRGISILRGFVPETLVDDALKAINTFMRVRGFTIDEAQEWSDTACWFPELSSSDHPWNDMLVALRGGLDFGDGDVWTQVAIQFPDPPGSDRRGVKYHVDRQIPDRNFHTVAGVSLTPSGGSRGGLAFPSMPDLALDPGDVAVFSADEPHTGGVNTSGQIRYAVYFRWLDALA